MIRASSVDRPLLSGHMITLHLWVRPRTPRRNRVLVFGNPSGPLSSFGATMTFRRDNTSVSIRGLSRPVRL